MARRGCGAVACVAEQSGQTVFRCCYWSGTGVPRLNITQQHFATISAPVPHANCHADGRKKNIARRATLSGNRGAVVNSCDSGKI